MHFQPSLRPRADRTSPWILTPPTLPDLTGRSSYGPMRLGGSTSETNQVPDLTVMHHPSAKENVNGGVQDQMRALHRGAPANLSSEGLMELRLAELGESRAEWQKSRLRTHPRLSDCISGRSPLGKQAQQAYLQAGLPDAERAPFAGRRRIRPAACPSGVSPHPRLKGPVVGAIDTRTSSGRDEASETQR
jgi:hypothetical protein